MATERADHRKLLARSTFSVDEAAALARDLIVELEDFAFKSERILARLDMRAARRARGMASELRGLLQATGVGASFVEAQPAFYSLIDDAVVLLAPPERPSATSLEEHSRAFDDPDEVTNPGLSDDARRELLSRACE